MQLRTTLVGVLVIIGFVLSGTIYVGFGMHKASVVEQERGEVQRTAAVVSNRIDTRIGTLTDTVDLWSTTLADDDGSAPDTFSSLSTFVNQTAFDRAEVYTDQGTLEWVAGPTLSDGDFQVLVGTDHSDETFLVRALDGERFVSPPVRSITGHYVVRIATPIRNDDGAIVGVLSGTFEVDERSLLDDVSSIGHPSDRVVVTAGNRTLFNESRPEGRSLSANATVEQTGWSVSVSRPRSTVSAQLNRAAALQIGGVFVGILAISVVGIWVSRTTMARIRRLLDALGDLEAGTYRTDLDLGRIDEWQRMSDRFNSLARTLEQRDTQLSVLNRILRHNLRNDMNVITARAERGLADESTPPALERDLETIHDTAAELIATSEHARTLHEQLLDRPKRAIEPVDVVSVVEGRVETLGTEHPSATIDTNVPEAAWALDAAVLPIVVEEIIRNAIVHNDVASTDPHVSITIESVTPAAEAVDAETETRIVVEDNGPGIPQVEAALLTDDISETSLEHGSGLGVWLINWLVDRIGGTITVSTGVERGSTVTIHLPAPPEPPEQPSVDGSETAS